MTQPADGVRVIDLQFQGLPGVIAAYLIEDSGERALVEVGPGSTFENLLAGLEAAGVQPGDIGKLLVTHIHLDHFGAAGSFIKRFPDTELYVHELGAPHAIDPSRLLKSAGRIYGDAMWPLWGEVMPVPADRVRALHDGDVVRIGTRSLRAVYTPGHASHHIVYHDADAGLVFTGDVAAVRLQGFEYVRPPTPPPDLDLDAWSHSLERLARLRARAMYLTHYGRFEDVPTHLEELWYRLSTWRDVVAQATQEGQDRAQIIRTLQELGDAELTALGADSTAIRQYELGSPYFMTVDGFLRYFRKQAEG